MRTLTATPHLLLLLLGAWVTAPATVLALNSDGRMPIHIEADRAEINEEQGSSVYRGNVTIDQGTLRITADQIKILTAGSEIVQIVASGGQGSGKLAHYEQQPNPEQDPVYADAREILYQVREETLQLSGQARLQQATDTFRGELLRYHVRDGTVSLAGSTGTDQEKPGRISISLTPPKSSGEDAATTDAKAPSTPPVKPPKP